MPAACALEMIGAFYARGVSVCVGGGWGVDALVGEQTRTHADLDLWVDAVDTEELFAVLVEQGLDRILPWPGDRPWNFVVHDGDHRRVDLHLYERLGGERLHFGSVADPFYFFERDLSGHGQIAGRPVRCESPEFSLACHAGYELRDTDRHDIAVLCERFELHPPSPKG